MAKPIQMWKSLDGRVFPSREDADAHDEALQIIRQHRFNKPNIYPELVKILRDSTLVPRVYPQEPNHE